MDSISEDSPLLRIILVADHIEQLCCKSPLLICCSCFFIACYIKFGFWADLWTVIGFGCWFQRAVVVEWMRTFSSSQLAALSILIFLSTVFIYGSRWRDSTHSKAVVNGRLATDLESQLELAFRRYLQHLVRHSPNPLIVDYIPSGIMQRTEERFLSPSASGILEAIPHTKIKVAKPSFYTRFVYYAHDIEAMFSEMAESHTVSVEPPDVLLKIFLKKPAPSLHTSNVLDFIYFQIIRRLRRRPANGNENLSAKTVIDIRNFRISAMDAYVLEQDDLTLKRNYRSTVIRLFLADRVTNGSTRIILMLEGLGRMTISWTLAGILFREVSPG